MSQTRQRQLRIGLLNCEDLFVFMDQSNGQPIETLNEKEWQSMSSSPTGNKPLRKLRWLADTLTAMDADILLLNEIGGRESMDNFARYFLKGRYQPYMVEGNSDRGIDIGYMVRRTLEGRFLLRSHRHRALKFNYPNEVESRRKTHYFSRDLQELRWYDVDGKTLKMIFLLVHLKSRLDPRGVDPGGRLRRRAEAELLSEIYKEIRAEFPGTSVVVGGDFNGQAAGPKPDEEFLCLLDTDLSEAFHQLNIPPEKSASQVSLPKNGRAQLLKIDHIFLSPELHSNLVAEGSEVFLYRSELGIPMPYVGSIESRNALPSDHYPLVINLSGL